jgi:hypothetical protein
MESTINAERIKATENTNEHELEGGDAYELGKVAKLNNIREWIYKDIKKSPLKGPIVKLQLHYNYTLEKYQHPTPRSGGNKRKGVSGMRECIAEALKGLLGEKTTEVYHGTVDNDILAAVKEAEKELKEAHSAYEARRKEHWDRIVASLKLDPDGSYSLNKLTGQVTERVSVDKFKEDEPVFFNE